MMGKKDNRAELQRAHLVGDAFAEFDFLSRHSKDPDYGSVVQSDAYKNLAQQLAEKKRSLADLYTRRADLTEQLRRLDDSVELFLTGHNVQDRPKKDSRIYGFESQAKNLYTPHAEFLTLRNHSLVSMMHTVRDLEELRKDARLDAVAVEPDEHFRDYVKENIGDIPSMKLAQTGHDIVVLRYAEKKGLPIFCLGKETSEGDVAAIKRSMDSAGRRRLTGVVNQENYAFYLRQFSKSGFLVD